MFSVFKDNLSSSMWSPGAKFNFWNDVKKSRTYQKPRLNLRQFWIAAVAALAVQTSVWAEMGAVSKSDVQFNDVAIYSMAQKIRADDYGLPAHRLSDLSYQQNSRAVKYESTVVNPIGAFEVRGEELGGVDTGLLVRASLPTETVQNLIEEFPASVTSLVGVGGVRRLADFARYGDGWNGVGSYGLQKESLENFERFFGSPDFAPDDVAVFMSSSGNVVANWLKEGGLIELEFAKADLHYFIEKNDLEGSVARKNYGDFKRFLKSI